MLILDTTTKSIEIVLGMAVASELPWTASYVTLDTTTFVPASTDGTTNGTTAVTLVGNPASTFQRQLKFLSVNNINAGSAIVEIRLNDNSTLRRIVRYTLGTGDILTYVDSEGFSVQDSTGATKSVSYQVIVGIGLKNGIEVSGSFAGSPKTAAIVFGSAYPDDTYSISISAVTDGSKSYAPSIENKTAAGFTVNLQSNNLTGLVEVDWQTQRN